MFSWILDKVGALFGSKYAKSIARTVVAMLSGVLLSAGLPQEAVDKFALGFEPVLTGLIILALAQVASWVDKYKNQRPAEPKIVRLK